MVTSNMRAPFQRLLWIGYFLLGGSRVLSFSSMIRCMNTIGKRRAAMKSFPLFMTTTNQDTDTESCDAEHLDDTTDLLYIPRSFDEMVKQSSAAMRSAYQQGITRQIVRILLPRSSDNDQILQYIENDANNDLRNSILVPPDETWQGGIMQLYRAASISAQEMLR